MPKGTKHGNTDPSSSTGEGSSSRLSDPVTLETTQHSGEIPDTEVIFAGEVVRQIEAVVESFRTGGIKKTQAIVKISGILDADPTGNEQLKSESLDRYVSTLNGIEALAAQSNERGLRYTNTALGKRKEGSSGGGERHEESNGDNAGASNEIDIDDFIEGLSKGDDLQLGENDPSEGSGDDSDRESNNGLDERGRSNKKQRIYESQMPWFDAEQRVRKSCKNRSCNKTRNTLDVFQRDPVTVKRWIRCASTAPAGFANSEWDSLIKGETVDLHTVFSSLHHVRSIDESIGRIGATEIQFGKPKPAVKVETSGQWTAAFNLVIKATSFLFPHRDEELRQYGDYMEELFSAKSTAVHPRLFKYDEAVRYKVGQGQSILLTDRTAFTRYYEAIVAPDGVGIEGEDEGGKAGPRKGGKPGERSDICHRFNASKGCNLTADKCKYKHICKKCRSRGHGKVDCKVDEAV
jgi:hypothetical protein